MVVSVVRDGGLELACVVGVLVELTEDVPTVVCVEIFDGVTVPFSTIVLGGDVAFVCGAGDCGISIVVRVS